MISDPSGALLHRLLQSLLQFHQPPLRSEPVFLQLILLLLQQALQLIYPLAQLRHPPLLLALSFLRSLPHLAHLAALRAQGRRRPLRLLALSRQSRTQTRNPPRCLFAAEGELFHLTLQPQEGVLVLLDGLLEAGLRLFALAADPRFSRLALLFRLLDPALQLSCFALKSSQGLLGALGLLLESGHLFFKISNTLLHAQGFTLVFIFDAGPESNQLFL